MELELRVITPGHGDEQVKEATRLSKELHNNLREARVTQKEEPIPDGKAGGALDAVLHIVMGKDFLEKLLDVLKSWIDGAPARTGAKQSEMQATIKRPDGTEQTVTIKGKFDPKDILAQLNGVPVTATETTKP